MSASVEKKVRGIQAKKNKRFQSSSASRTLTPENVLERMRREFISTVSHELYTPLTAILGFSELLLNLDSIDGICPDAQKEYLGIIYEKAKDLMKIVHTLLVLDGSRDERKNDFDKNFCNVEVLVAEAMLDLPKNLDNDRLEIRLTDGSTTIWGDRKKMGQALEALLSNALKFTRDGVVRLSGERIENFYYFTVEDEGGGISLRDREKIFQPFFRVDSSNTAREGLGLGLSFAKAIVEAHGGSIRLKTSTGVGTTFIVSIPIQKV
jgi:signal transduction histidine kinase